MTHGELTSVSQGVAANSVPVDLIEKLLQYNRERPRSLASQIAVCWCAIR